MPGVQPSIMGVPGGRHARRADDEASHMTLAFPTGELFTIGVTGYDYHPAMSHAATPWCEGRI